MVRCLIKQIVVIPFSRSTFITKSSFWSVREALLSTTLTGGIMNIIFKWIKTSYYVTNITYSQTIDNSLQQYATIRQWIFLALPNAVTTFLIKNMSLQNLTKIKLFVLPLNYILYYKVSSILETNFKIYFEWRVWDFIFISNDGV